MNGARCERCRKLWTICGNPDLFQVIGRVCPPCLDVLIEAGVRGRQLGARYGLKVGAA